ncbi:hypothetical protein [Nocardia abscessus]|uniref:hypothetical protein n=1 Tax=Nocardia abscessus TaxID=120957 RepID=UPI0024581AC5|nr:hypothetical protein [Nocardia abscessus]
MNRFAPARYHNDVNPIWLYEARRCGGSVLALPPLVAVAIGIASAVFSANQVLRTAAIEAIPLVAGLACATAVGRERSIELQLSVRVPYPVTVGRRVALIVGTTACAVVIGGLPATGTDAPAVLGGNLVFALALIGIATCVGAGFGSTSGASAVVTTVWLAKLLLLNEVARHTQAVLLLAIAASCVWPTLLRVTDSEAQLHGERR